MSKKFLALLLSFALVLSFACLTACGPKDNSSLEESSSTQTPPTESSSNGGETTVTYTATFMVDGEVYHTYTGERNSVVEAPAEDPVKEGYTFVGWSGYNANYKLKSNKTFTAQWEKTMNGLPTASEFQTAGSASLSDGYTVGVYEAKKISTSIDVDGVLDDAYLDATPIQIAERADGTVNATGFAYVVWDASYIYVFVSVADADTHEYESGDRWLSDSVEFVLDTYNKASGQNQNYGDGYRGGNYIGEGQFRVNAGGNTVTGMHWMFDDGNISKTAASRVVEGEGYTAEFKISWGSFGTATAGKQVAFALLINDGANGNRTGVTAIEAGQIHAFEWAGVLSKLNLVA